MAATKFPWREELDINVGSVKFLASECLTDIEIVCGSYKFKAHKLVLSMASGFFNTLSDSAFIEGQTSTVRLDEEQPALVARLLLFAYTSSYPTTPVSEQPIPQFKMLPEPLINEGALATEWTFRAKIHAHMYQLADKYDMPLLKTQARQRFLISFQEQDEYTSEMDWIDADEWHHCDWTRTADVISYVYTEAPCAGCGLRDIVLDYYMAQIHTSNSYRPLIGSAAMRNLVANTPGFAADVALSAECDNLFKCESCDVKNEPSLAWRCGCGKVDSCDREECIRRGKKPPSVPLVMDSAALFQ